MTNHVVARTGCRIDLAGGTLDIWPLGLMHAGARTVNLAIDVSVRVELHRRESGYLVRSGDREYRVEELDELRTEPDAALVAVIGGAIDLPPVRIEFESASPRGGGLGASSAIGVALIAAAERLTGARERSAMERAMLVRDLEARLMGRPTGIQDQLPPLLGGALEIVYRPGGDEVNQLDVDLESLARRMTLFFSGKSHVSGDTNWQVIRNRLEGDRRTTELFERITEVSRSLASSLIRNDFEEVGRLVGEEWSARRQLAEGVSTPEVEGILEAAVGAGAWGGKAGGAGGGGCVVVLHPAGRADSVRQAAVAAGGTVIPGAPTSEGLQLEES